jgi:hypothetical protein
MKKLFYVLMLLGFVFMTGCASYLEFIGRSIQPVNVHGAGTVTMYNAKDYDILGKVTVRGNSVSVLGCISIGKEGDALLWDEAVQKYGDKVTGLKDITNSYDYTTISFIFPILSQVERTYMATAIREK